MAHPEGMYLPSAFAVEPERAELLADTLLRARGSVELVTFDGVAPVASLIPALWEPAPGPDRAAGSHGVRGQLLGHLARANPQWSSVAAGSHALAIVRGPEGYVSPSWYPAKAAHGRVVPTWNYVAVHLTGELVVHDDPVWLRGVVERLTRRHEEGRAEPWHLDDAPDRFLAGSLRAIVGVELSVTRIEAKAQLSQNRDRADADGVRAGLRADGGPAADALADAMDAWAAPASDHDA